METQGKMIEETKDLLRLKVPRYIGSKHTELVCFCDASDEAFANAYFLFNKLRMLPRKTILIPLLLVVLIV